MIKKIPQIEFKQNVLNLKINSKVNSKFFTDFGHLWHTYMEIIKTCAYFLVERSSKEDDRQRPSLKSL